MKLTMNEATFSLRALKDSSNLVSSFWSMLPNSNSVSLLSGFSQQEQTGPSQFYFGPYC